MRKAGKVQVPTALQKEDEGRLPTGYWLESERRRAGEPKVGRDQAGEGLPTMSGHLV
jgi:hypothetical protein